MDVPRGEWSETKPATDEIQRLCDQVNQEVKKKTGGDYKEFKALFYREKDILVFHYIIKVYVGDEYLHLWVYKSISTGQLIIGLEGVQEHHKRDDPLKPFDEN